MWGLFMTLYWVCTIPGYQDERMFKVLLDHQVTGICRRLESEGILEILLALGLSNIFGMGAEQVLSNKVLCRIPINAIDKCALEEEKRIPLWTTLGLETPLKTTSV